MIFIGSCHNISYLLPPYTYLYLYLSQISKDCKYLSTTATFEIGNETFTCTGKTLLDPGYTVVMHWQALGKNETVPNFVEGQIYEIQDVSFLKLQCL